VIGGTIETKILSRIDDDGSDNPASGPRPAQILATLGIHVDDSRRPGVLDAPPLEPRTVDNDERTIESNTFGTALADAGPIAVPMERLRQRVRQRRVS